MEKPNYIYRATLDRIVDGDTIDVNIDVGFYTTLKKRLRFMNIDTEELRGGTEESKEEARLAVVRLEELLNMGKIYVQTYMDATGKYGRVLADLFIETYDGKIIDVSKTLVAEGYAKGDNQPLIENIQFVN